MKDFNENRPGYKNTKVGWKCMRLGELLSKGKEGLPVLSVTVGRGLVPRDTLERKMAQI